LASLGLERYLLVTPSDYNFADVFGWVDLGLISFSLGLFIFLFFMLRAKLRVLLEGEDVVMGEIVLREDEVSKVEKLDRNDLAILRLPLLLGLLITILYVIWSISVDNSIVTSLSIVNVVPLCLPLIVLVAFITMCAKSFWTLFDKRAKIVVVILAGILGILAGAFWSGGTSDFSSATVSTQDLVSAKSIEGIWNSRCASCHGMDGRFNEKFVREFYPLPQKLSLERLDSLGTDSLVNVILNGRINMNPYRDRVTEVEARGLVQYMRFLAGDKQ
jgi:mono/diheme cytochrome c family protein